MRRQLAVYSPIPAASIAAAAASLAGINSDSREGLRATLMAMFSADDCVLCDSGTHALQLGIRCARELMGPDAPVAIPAFQCYDVATAALGAGSPVMLYDVDPVGLGPDHESLEQTLIAGARIVVIAPLYGIPVDWEALEAQAARHGALLVEDAAQGHGALWKSRPLGSLGRISTLSFGRGKGWTGGGGGAVLLRNVGSPSRIQGSAGRLSDLSTLAALVAQALLGRPSVYGIPSALPGLHLGETTYHPPSEPGGQSRASSAALLRSSEASRREAAARRQNAARYLADIVPHERVRFIQVREQGVSGYLRFPLLLQGGLPSLGSRDRVLRLGIAPSYPITLAALGPLASHLAGRQQRYEGAERLARDLITLPSHSLLSEGERREIVELVQKAASPAAQRPH